MTRDVDELLAELIRNACVNDGTPQSGQEARSVHTLRGFLGEPTKVFEPLPGRQSALYRVPGRGTGPSLLLLGHLDVVPANPQTWTVDPFAAERRAGFIWGRGAVDMLNQTSAMAAAFLPYWRQDQAPLRGDLLFAAVADEEAGGGYGVQHMLAEDRDLSRVQFVLTEIAAPHLRVPSGRGLPVTVAEKGPAWRRLRTRGTPGHASQPYRTRNALVSLARALARLAEDDSPVAITGEWREFAGALGLDDAFVDPDRLDEAIATLDDAGFARWVHACTHLTIAPTMMAAGTKSNVIPDGAVAEVDVRVLPGQDSASVDDHFRKVLGPDLMEQIEVEEVLHTPANASPPSGPLWDSLAAAHQQVVGAGPLIPTLIPVSTDARFFRRMGAIAYGAGIFDEQVGFGDLLGMFHGNDERVSETSLRLTTEFFDAVLESFGGSNGE